MATPAIRAWYDGCDAPGVSQYSSGWTTALTAGDSLYLFASFFNSSGVWGVGPGAGWTLLYGGWRVQIWTKTANGSNDSPVYTSLGDQVLLHGVATVGPSTNICPADMTEAYAIYPGTATLPGVSAPLAVSDARRICVHHASDWYAGSVSGTSMFPTITGSGVGPYAYWNPYGEALEQISSGSVVLTTNSPGILSPDPQIYGTVYGVGSSLVWQLFLTAGGGGGPSFNLATSQQMAF